ncbi:type VI secretion system baseplate subunit TssG [Reinekea sp.]|jgi:hypothetical protein|uniref:type VI secretion system baseplate subunit TssG n=1 Tax=Reinekea sp. TaxID=1970455 RepID=UPI002A810007|nr:type VI secretion system baseplate subunit TssG [Reinekea sp.]
MDDIVLAGAAAERSSVASATFGPLLPAFYAPQVEFDEQGPLPALLALLLAPLQGQAEAMADHYQPVLQQTRHARSSFTNFQRSDVLADLTETGQRVLSASQWSRLNRLFGDVTGSWQGAIALLACLFPGKLISLQEGVVVERYLPSAQMTGLGGANALGAYSVLGYKLQDRMNGCRFRLATFNAQDVQDYASDDYLALTRILLQRYVGQPLAIELVLQLTADAQKNTALGEPMQAILGVKTWLAAAELQEKEIVIAL